MTEFTLMNEATIRLCFFAGLLISVIILEQLLPCRKLRFTRWVRWPANIGIATLNTLIIRVIFPAGATSFALLAQEQNWGILNNVDAPIAAKIVLSVIVLDLVIFTQHIAFHKIPILWRLHRMHHADLDFDVTTGSRFHPLEIIISMSIKLILIGILGAPAIAVIVFEIILNATSMFNHGNVQLPKKLDRLLRLVVVSPDMHRVHHSSRPQEFNSNFGFNLPWWDRLFSTYVEQPQDCHKEMEIGLKQFRDQNELRLHKLLTQPFR